MKIIEENLRKGMLKLKVECEEDLWLLYTIIVKGDIVYSKTTREVKVEGARGPSSRRLPMTLGLKVEYAEFQPFTGKLRVHGIIIDAPENFGLKGLHHTFSLGVGSEIVVIKEHWSKYLIKKIKEHVRSKVKVLTVALDYDEVAVGILYDYGLRDILNFEFRLPGKDSRDRDEILERRLEELTGKILEIINTQRINMVIIGSPGFLKDIVLNMVRERLRGLDVHVHTVNISTGGVKGLREIIRRDEILNIIKDYRVVIENRLLDEALKRLAKTPNLIAYGVEEVAKAAELGAVDKLLVLDELVRTFDVELRTTIENIMVNVEKSRGEIFIVSSQSESGVTLKSLGGIVALLRFKIT